MTMYTQMQLFLVVLQTESVMNHYEKQQCFPNITALLVQGFTPVLANDPLHQAVLGT